MATFTFYNLWKEAQFDGNLTNSPIDFDTDTVKLALANSSYTPAQTHDNWDDVNANEVSGSGYTAGGETVTITVTQTGGTVTVDGSNVTWSQNASGFTNARYAILYKDSGTPATSPLVGYIDFTSDKGNQSGDLTVQWNASGIFTAA